MLGLTTYFGADMCIFLLCATLQVLCSCNNNEEQKNSFNEESTSFDGSDRTSPQARVEENIKKGILEPIEISFNQFDFSKIYIDKYKLSYEETLQVGLWFVYGSRTSYNQNCGPGISITYLPNRIFKTYKTNVSIGDIEYTFGYWKIVDRNLLIMPKVVAIRKELFAHDFIEHNNDEYYRIMKVPEYELAYINTEPYSFSEIPNQVIDLFGYEDDDSIRYRLIWDTLGDPPGDLNPDSINGSAFLIEELKSDNIRILMDVW